MKKFYFLILTIIITSISIGQDMVITSVFDGSLSGGTPKGVELYVINDIADVSVYGISSANNGDGTTAPNPEFNFPTVSANQGDFIYVSSEEVQFMSFFGFMPDYTSGSMVINGDDAIELFFNGTVIDVFGDVDTDGNGEPWEYTDGWAYRISATGPDGNSFISTNWNYSGTDSLDGETTNTSASNPIPIGTYTITMNTDPAISISTPSNNQEFAPGTTSVSVEWGTTNTSGGETVNITVNGTTSNNQVSPFLITAADGQTYDVTVELVDGVVLDSDMVSFSVLSATDVVNIASLRSGNFSDTYKLTGEAIVSYVVTDNERNQRYIQDATGGILIDDPNGILEVSLNQGDGIQNVVGQLSEFNGILQLTPIADLPAISSSGNSITPETITISNLINNGEDYESELIFIDNVVFSNAGVFEHNENYSITDGTDTTIASVTFQDEDLVGANIPTTASSVIGLGAEFQGEYRIYPRFLSDVEGATLLINDFKADNINIYPNPVTGAYVNVQNKTDERIAISVFDILGKQLISTYLENNRIDVSELNSGIYLLKLSQNNASITKKLIIR